VKAGEKGGTLLAGKVSEQKSLVAVGKKTQPIRSLGGECEKKKKSNF